MKKLLITVLIFSLGMVTANAQKFDFEFDVKITDYNNIGKRKLAVALLEEDSRAIAEYTRNKGSNPKGLENYKAFIKSYNENIEKAVAKYWKLNTTVEYKKLKEIKKLVDDKDRDYAVLAPIEANSSKEYLTHEKGSATMLVLYKTEKPDEYAYKIMMPYSFSRADGNNPLSDYYFTIQAAAANISYMIEKKKTSDFVDFMETQAIANCKELKNKNLLVERELIGAAIEKREIKGYYKNKFEIVAKNDVVTEAVTAENEENCYIVLIPYTVYTNPMAREPKPILLCYKLIVDAGDGTILNYMTGKAKTGTEEESLVKEKDFDDLNSCDK